jgi:hypothetical protein
MITARPGGHHAGSWRGVNAWCCTPDTSEMLGSCHNHACPIVQYSTDKFRDLEVRDRWPKCR